MYVCNCFTYAYLCTYVGPMYVCMCKKRDFSLLHHFWHRTKDRSQHLNHAKYTKPFPVFPLPVSPNPSKLTQIYVLASHCCVTLLSYDIGQHVETQNTYFSQCIIWYLAYKIRTLIISKPSPLFLASLFEYNHDRVLIRGFDKINIGCQSPKSLTSVLHELRDLPAPPGRS